MPEAFRQAPAATILQDYLSSSAPEQTPNAHNSKPPIDTSTQIGQIVKRTRIAVSRKSIGGHIEHALAMNEAIASKLVSIFRDVLDDETIVILPNTTADNIDGWDSFSHIRLVLAVERAFKVKFSAKEINSLENVGEFTSLIKSKL